MRRSLAALLALSLLLAGCFFSDPTPTPGMPGETPTGQTPTPTSQRSATPTSTPIPVSGLPDGPLLALSPGDGTTITSQAALVRGTVESGATVRINGTTTEVDQSGDFFVAVIVAPGENVIVVDVTGADGTKVHRELRVNGS